MATYHESAVAIRQSKVVPLQQIHMSVHFIHQCATKAVFLRRRESKLLKTVRERERERERETRSKLYNRLKREEVYCSQKNTLKYIHRLVPH